jgi:hypothetical protein
MRVRHLAVLRGAALGGTVLAILLTPVSAPAAAAVIAPRPVTVRVYNASGLDTAAVQQALAAAAPSLASADVDVSWVLCQGATRCTNPLGAGELTVRMVRAPHAGFRGELPLGDALVDPAVGGVLATVYVDRVEWLARQAGTSMPTLLGRAIAHELGHLLLASRAHRKYGLMRAVWSQDELSRGRLADWTFTREDRRAIHARRVARVEDANIVWGTE